MHLYILQLFPFDRNSCWKSTTSFVMKEGKGEKKCRNICCWSSGLQRYFGRTIFTAPFLCAQSFRPITSGYSSRKSSYTPEPQLPAPPQPTHLNNGHPKPNSGHSYGYGNGTGHSQYNNPAGLYAHNGSTGDRSLPSKMGSLSISATHRWGLTVWDGWTILTGPGRTWCVEENALPWHRVVIRFPASIVTLLCFYLSLSVSSEQKDVFDACVYV